MTFIDIDLIQPAAHASAVLSFTLFQARGGVALFCADDAIGVYSDEGAASVF